LLIFFFFFFFLKAGSVLEGGDIIGIITLDDPSRVRHAQPFDGQLPKMGSPNAINNKANHQLKNSIKTLDLILSGYDNQNKLSESLRQMAQALRNPQLPFLELNELLSALATRMPSKLVEKFTSLIKASSSTGVFPARDLQVAAVNGDFLFLF